MYRKIAYITMEYMEYVAYYNDVEISRARSLVRVSKALAKFIKGQHKQ